MDTTTDRNTGRPDLPQHTRRAPPGQDRRRAAWIILAVVAAALALGAVLAFTGAGDDPSLPDARAATAANAPAMAVPPARN
jgi:flagellar basal body-associated protein FliL